jgi:DNA-directed RNA polymerase omega subunit
MINTPTLTDLKEKVDSRYLLVTAVAKRARELQAEDPECLGTMKPVSYAVEEIADGEVRIVDAHSKTQE